MSNQTFYLKYRPATLSELDNIEIAEKLTCYLRNGKSPHAFLLVGYKGTGKTSSARLIAKIVNCKKNIFSGKGKNVEPCNECPSCVSIREGNNPDVLEIDAASNTSVDDVRDLREKVRLSPQMSRFKVYIIDEVHMISRSAFNALLKTLEEPPEKTVFILATTEVEKVPETIRSRCMVLNFKMADEIALKRSLSRIIKGEKLNVESDAIDQIIRLAGGSFRDAAKILEQAVYLSQGKITTEIIQKISGGQNADDIFELLNTITSANNIALPIQKIEDLKERSIDLRAFVKQTLEILHRVLLCQIGLEQEDKKISNLSKEIPPELLKAIIQEFEKAWREMKYSEIPELQIELAILEIQNTKTGSGSSESIKQLDNSKHNSKKDDNRISENPGPVKPADEFWNNLIYRVNEKSKQLAAVMRSCKLKQIKENSFIIETTSKFHFDRLHEAKAANVINQCACEIAGHDVKIKTTLISKN